MIPFPLNLILIPIKQVFFFISSNFHLIRSKEIASNDKASTASRFIIAYFFMAVTAFMFYIFARVEAETTGSRTKKWQQQTAPYF